MADEYLPIKIIFPEAKDTVTPHTGGGKRKIFNKENFTEQKELINNDITSISEHYSDAFEQHPAIPCVAKVNLRKDAIAKSHRPTRLINDRTCPIIGIRNLGELLISVSKEGITSLKNIMQDTETRAVKAAISAIERIVPYGPDDIIRSDELEYIKSKLEKDSLSIKLKIFNHQNPDINQLLNTEINGILNTQESQYEEIQYAENYYIYKIDKISPSLFDEVVNFIGTQSVSVFPYYSQITSQFYSRRDLLKDDLPPPESDVDYPIIGIIDSGIDPDNSSIKPWIVDRHEYITKDQRNYDHGTFVAGLCIHPRLLNNNDPRFPGTPAKVIDVIAIPDENKGRIYEDRLLEIINEVIPLHPEVKVWNLSLGFSTILCIDDKFSDFAISLDEIQKSNNIIITISAGNYDNLPMRGWPRNNIDSDRIISPADSVMGLTVGSIANIENANTLVKIDEPSPFTRRGPGPSFIPKPELSHYGGNCSINGSYSQTGVLSLGTDNKLSECIGTSFSTPLVSNILSNIINSVKDDISIPMAKALLIQSSVIKNDSLDAANIKYHGFGKPMDIIGILNCHPWSVTMILEVNLIPGLVFHKWPFPLPNCLRNSDGSFKGDICMTLVYDTPLDPQFGAEYCRTNVDVSLGTYDVDSDGTRRHQKKIPLNPLDISELYEKHLIEHGFKWSPVKVYKRRLTRVSGDTWRLYIKSQHRKEHISEDPQSASLVISISDPTKSQPVYDQFISNINRIGWHAADLNIRERVRTIITA